MLSSEKKKAKYFGNILACSSDLSSQLIDATANNDYLDATMQKHGSQEGFKSSSFYHGLKRKLIISPRTALDSTGYLSATPFKIDEIPLAGAFDACSQTSNAQVIKPRAMSFSRTQRPATAVGIVGRRQLLAIPRNRVKKNDEVTNRVYNDQSIVISKNG